MRSIVLGFVALALAGTVAWQGVAIRTLSAEHAQLVTERDAAVQQRDDYGVGIDMNAELLNRCHRVQRVNSEGYAF